MSFASIMNGTTKPRQTLQKYKINKMETNELARKVYKVWLLDIPIDSLGMARGRGSKVQCNWDHVTSTHFLRRH